MKKALFSRLLLEYSGDRLSELIRLMTPVRIKFIRHKFGLTQVNFADFIGISVNTYRNWEIGHRNPSGPAIALLYIADTHPDIFKKNRKELLQEFRSYNLR